MWLDLVYGVNVDPIPPKVGLQIIQFLSQLGHYKLPDGKDDYEGTTRMIDAVAENIKASIGHMSNFDKVDLAMASMIIPVPPSVMLANELMTGISEADIVQACYDLVLKTEHFEIYVEDDKKEIKKTNFAIEIISDYLKGISGKEGVTRKQFRKKFSEIQAQLRGANNSPLKCSCGWGKCELDFGKFIFDLLRFKLNIFIDDINYNVNVETLKRHKFVEYFYAAGSFSGSIKDDIWPPRDAKEIFMGGGISGSNVVKMGVFGTTDELFDRRQYPRNRDTYAKRVRKYYSYYDSGHCKPFGFSKTSTIRLHNVDVSDLENKTKLSACRDGTAGGCTIWRCGSSNLGNTTDFGDTFEMVFYYRI